MSKKIIHVNQHFIKANEKDGGNRPVLTVKDSGETIYAREVIIEGPSKVVYNGKQLGCGARCWIETYADVTYIDRQTFDEARDGAI